MNQNNLIVKTFIEHYLTYYDSVLNIQDFLNELYFPYTSPITLYRTRNVIQELLSENKITCFKIGKKKYYKKTNKLKKIHIKSTNHEKRMIYSLDDKMTLGTEIEFASNIESEILVEMLKMLPLKHSISEDGSSYLDKSKIDYNTWFFTTDGSVEIQGYKYGYEIVSPILNKSTILELKLMLSFLKRLNKIGLIKQDITCGGHVHHGGLKISLNKAITFFETSQSVMNYFVAPHRVYSPSKLKWYESRDYIAKTGVDADILECYYCRPVVKDLYYNNYNKISFNHEKYLNFRINNYNKNGTIELRQHEATLNFKRLLAWIILGQCALKATKKHYISELKQKRSVREFLKFIDVKKPIMQFYHLF